MGVALFWRGDVLDETAMPPRPGRDATKPRG